MEQEGVVEAAQRVQDGALSDGELVGGVRGAALLECGVDGGVQVVFGDGAGERGQDALLGLQSELVVAVVADVPVAEGLDQEGPLLRLGVAVGAGRRRASRRGGVWARARPGGCRRGGAGRCPGRRAGAEG